MKMKKIMIITLLLLIAVTMGGAVSATQDVASNDNLTAVESEDIVETSFDDLIEKTDDNKILFNGSVLVTTVTTSNFGDYFDTSTGNYKANKTELTFEGDFDSSVIGIDNININKPVTLHNGNFQGISFDIMSDGVVLENLTVDTYSGEYAINIESNLNNITLLGNSIFYNYGSGSDDGYAIKMGSILKNITLSNNYISFGYDGFGNGYGIYAERIENLSISNNMFSYNYRTSPGNYYNSLIRLKNANNVTISQNIATNITYSYMGEDYSKGILIEDSEKIVFCENVISINPMPSSGYIYGIDFSRVNNATILNNSIELRSYPLDSSNVYGFKIASENFTFANNTILLSNSQDGDNDYGIYIKDSSNGVLEKNTVMVSNAQSIAQLVYCDSNVNNVNFTTNTLRASANDVTGMFMYMAESSVFNNRFYLIGSKATGIRFKNSNLNIENNLINVNGTKGYNESAVGIEVGIGGEVYIFNNTINTNGDYTIDVGTNNVTIKDNKLYAANLVGDRSIINFDNANVLGNTPVCFTPIIDITISDMSYGESDILIAHILSNGTPLENAALLIYLDTELINNCTTDSNGSVSCNMSSLGVGLHNIAVTFEGNPNNYNVTHSDSFTVNKAVPVIGISVDNFDYGKTGHVNITVPRLATGSIRADIGNDSYMQYLDGTGVVSVELSNITAGNYTVYVEYDGDPNYMNSSNSTDFSVNRVDSNMSVSLADITYGQIAYVNVTLSGDATGNVTVEIGNVTVNAIAVDSLSLPLANLTAGNHTVMITYSGDANYLQSSFYKTLSVLTAAVQVNATVDTVSYGQNATLTVSLGDITGVVSVYVDGILVSDVDVNAGFALYTLLGFDAGEHIILVNYNGDDNHYASSQNVDFTVLKAESAVDISVDDIQYGETAEVNVTLSSDATGSITVRISQYLENSTGGPDPITYNISLQNGRSSLDVADLSAGRYTVNVQYSGDVNYNSKKASSVMFEVNKVSSSVSANDSTGDYGQNITIPVASVGASEIFYRIIDMNGYAVMDGIIMPGDDVYISGLGAGQYTINLTTVSDANHISQSSQAILTVNKITPDLSIEVQDISYSETAYVYVTIPGDAAGNVIVTVNGNNYTANPVNGSGSVVLYNLNAGSYVVTVNYMGDANYLGTSNSTSFTVAKLDSQLSVSVSNVSAGENAHVYVTLPSDATGNVSVTVNGKSYVLNLVNGSGSVDLSNLNAGSYVVSVNYGGDANYLGTSNSTSFTVTKLDSQVNVSVGDVSAGETVYVNVTLPSDATGNVSVSVGNSLFTGVLDAGFASVSLSGLTSGNYTAFVNYAGDSKYLGSSANATFSVNDVAADIEVSIANYTFGETGKVNIILPGDATGYVLVYVDDEFISNVAVAGGSAEYELSGIAAGTHILRVEYSGDSKYRSAMKNSQFTVEKITAELTVSADDIDCGEVAFVNVAISGDATGNVSVIVDGVAQSAGLVNGSVSVPFEGLAAGSHNVAVTYLGDSRYTASSANATFTVSKVASQIGLSVENIAYGNAEKINITLAGDASGTVSIYVGGSLKANVNVISGSAAYSMSGLEVGAYSVRVEYSGDSKYLPSQANATFTVGKLSPEIIVEVEDILLKGTETINVTLPDDTEGIVSIFVNEAFVSNVTVKNGFASYKMSGLNIGVYNVYVQYTGDSKYYKRSTESSFSVKPSMSILQNISIGESAKIYLDLGDAKGTILISLDGVPETIETIRNGIVDYSFQTDNLTARNHNITFQYYGDSFDANVFNYWDSNLNKYVPIKYGMYINPKVVDVPEEVEVSNEGIVILEFPEDATGHVEVFVDGISVTVVEIVDGIAEIDLSKYKNGNHIFSFDYSGNDYYDGFSKGVNYVKVSQIKSSALSVYYTAGKYYSVKVYDGKGNLVKGITVVFKIKGKQVGKTTTDANGVAKYKVSNVPGTYQISATAANVTVTKKVTVNHIVTLKSVTVKRSAKKLTLQVTLKKVNGKYLKNKKITFKFNGKKYTAKTDKKGVAKVTIKSSVLKKLKVGKKITYQATYLKDTVKKTVKVKK